MYKLGDTGLTLKVARRSVYRVVGDQVTHKKCPTCQEWIEVAEYKVHGHSLAPKCSDCLREYDRNYGEKRRRRLGIPERDYSEYHFIRLKSGRQGLKCKVCGVEDTLDAFRKVKGPNQAAYDRTCKSCRILRWRRQWLLRRGREALAENPEALQYFENEKRYNHLKALCRLWRIPSDRQLLIEDKREILRVLSDLPPGSQLLQEEINRVLPEVQARCRRYITMAMREMRPVQI